MRRLVLLAVLAVVASFAALTVAPAGDAYGYNCAIQDPPPSPYRVGSYMYGSTRTVCLQPAAKLQIVVCLVRYNNASGYNPVPRGCSVTTAYASTGVTGYTNTFCNYTTFLYTWRVSSYAIATLSNGATYKSPSVLSNATFSYCA